MEGSALGGFGNILPVMLNEAVEKGVACQRTGIPNNRVMDFRQIRVFESWALCWPEEKEPVYIP